jgi:hypothetical protein
VDAWTELYSLYHSSASSLRGRCCWILGIYRLGSGEGRRRFEVLYCTIIYTCDEGYLCRGSGWLLRRTLQKKHIHVCKQSSMHAKSQFVKTIKDYFTESTDTRKYCRIASFVEVLSVMLSTRYSFLDAMNCILRSPARSSLLLLLLRKGSWFFLENNHRVRRKRKRLRPDKYA